MLATALYVTVIALLLAALIEQGGAGGHGEVTKALDTAALAGAPRRLKIEATECAVRVQRAPGAAVRVTDASLTPSFHTRAALETVSLTDTGDCIVVACEGPNPHHGYLSAALVEIGDDASLASTRVEVKSAARSSILLSDAPCVSHPRPRLIK